MSRAEVAARYADPHSQDEYWANQRRHIALEPLMRTHVCTDCGGDLTLGRIPSGADEWPWALRCDRCGWRTDEQIRRRKSLTKLFKEGAALPLEIANKIERKVGGIPMDSKALMATSEAGMMARIERAKFPQALQPEEKRTLALAAITYGLDPLMGELTIYQGRPYVSIDGRYRKAQESGKLDGVASRPATQAERAEWSIPDGDFFFRAEVRVKGASFPFVGWGRVKGRELTDRSRRHPEYLASPVVAENPQRMAEKRAEAQALRKAFHLPIPSREDIGMGEETGLPEVNHVTGKIIDAECREVPARPAENAPVAAAVPNPPSQAENAPPAQPGAAEQAKEAQPKQDLKANFPTAKDGDDLMNAGQIKDLQALAERRKLNEEQLWKRISLTFGVTAARCTWAQADYIIQAIREGRK